MHKTGFNHYSAECLVKGGGREEGVMDFVQYVFPEMQKAADAADISVLFFSAGPFRQF